MTLLATPGTITPDPELRARIQDMSGQKISGCFQCGKCTSGCPVTFAMDIMPHKLMHLLKYGQVNEVLRSDTIWVCASCETCTTRCPNDIDIAHVMDTLRQLSRRQDMKTSQPSIPIFHAAFLNSIKKHGRVSETEMAIAYSVKNAGLFSLLKLTGYGLSLFLKGKVKLLPGRIRAVNYIKNLFRKAEASL